MKFSIIMAIFLCISVISLGGCGIKPNKLDSPTEAATGKKGDFPRHYPRN